MKKLTTEDMIQIGKKYAFEFSDITEDQCIAEKILKGGNSLMLQLEYDGDDTYCIQYWLDVPSLGIELDTLVRFDDELKGCEIMDVFDELIEWASEENKIYLSVAAKIESIKTWCVETDFDYKRFKEMM